MNNKAIVLISGGLDSYTALAIAKDQGFDCYAISFDYGQRHIAEIEASKRVAKSLGVKNHKIFKIDIGQFGGSALTNMQIDIPDFKDSDEIPITYVPARNTVFLSIAAAWGEVIGAYHLFMGANIYDYSGYPDCRPEYMQAFSKVLELGTKVGVGKGQKFKIHTPLINLNKAQIIETGLKLGLDYHMTVSCYQADKNGHACGTCDSCVFRKRGFRELGIEDQTIYAITTY